MVGFPGQIVVVKSTGFAPDRNDKTLQFPTM